MVLAVAAIAGGLAATFELKELTSIQILFPENHEERLVNDWVVRNIDPHFLFQKETIFAGVMKPGPYDEPSRLPAPEFDPLFNLSDPN